MLVWPCWSAQKDTPRLALYSLSPSLARPVPRLPSIVLHSGMSGCSSPSTLRLEYGRHQCWHWVLDKEQDRKESWDSELADHPFEGCLPITTPHSPNLHSLIPVLDQYHTICHPLILRPLHLHGPIHGKPHPYFRFEMNRKKSTTRRRLTAIIKAISLWATTKYRHAFLVHGCQSPILGTTKWISITWVCKVKHTRKEARTRQWCISEHSKDLFPEAKDRWARECKYAQIKP